MIWSIRRRLTLWNTLAVAVLLVALAGVVYGLSRGSLYRGLDRSLATELEELEDDLRGTGQPEQLLRSWMRESSEHDKMLCAVYDSDGHVYEKTTELAAASIPPMPSIGAGERRFADFILPVLGERRALVRRLQWAGCEFTVLLLAPFDDVERELARLRNVLFLAVPAGIVLAGVVGYLLARKALAPVDQLRRLTEQITAERLDRRLPVAYAGDELGLLTQTINAMIGRLERSFAEIRRFTADASHELRTPLTAIRIEAEVALRGSLDALDCRQLLGSVLEECEHLTRLTDQLLTLAREDAEEAGPGNEPVELTALLAGVVETMRPLAQAKGLKLEFPENGQVRTRGDQIRLRRVFYNLLDNAIKYTPEGGVVEVQLGSQDHTARVAVRDTGIGIPEEHLPRVFDRFYRVDKARSRDEGGTGLGLSIARRIVIAHGGEIELSSTPGEGTICTVVLPAEPATN